MSEKPDFEQLLRDLIDAFDAQEAAWRHRGKIETAAETAMRNARAALALELARKEGR